MVDTADPRQPGLIVELRNVLRENEIGAQPVRALDGIGLQLAGGQFVAIVGPSGAGRSTLLRLLCGGEVEKRPTSRIMPPPSGRTSDPP